MRLLVLAANYSSPEGIGLEYIHVRNKYYAQQGLDVTVLNFKASKSYIIDGINVITYSHYKKTRKLYDILVCHAANLQNHYRFLKKYEKRFDRLVFFFHGHEVLRVNEVYPSPYNYVSKSLFNYLKLQDLYDILKLGLWHKYYSKLAYKSHFVFVSNWMYEAFLHWTKIDSSIIENRHSIIYNSVGNVFEQNAYDKNSEKIYDFITIRSPLDGAKYGIDIVNNLAKSNPTLKFLVIGRGEFFSHIKKSDNVELINNILNHNELIEFINKSRCALIPTRLDAQGVMACEMATFGIPLITSDISVCCEVFDSFDNVELINNDDTSIDLVPLLTKLNSKGPYLKNIKYFAINTIKKECDLFCELMDKK